MSEVVDSVGGHQRSSTSPIVVSLSDEAASDDSATGGKAAALARASAAGLPVLPGFVLTTAGVANVDEAGGMAVIEREVRQAWEDLTDGGQTPLAVRSSSTAEDRGGDSMAGRFESVIGVRGWDDFRGAVETVLHSRASAAEGQPDLSPDHPIAVLVQPVLEATAGGVLFGVDPVTGRSDRLVVTAAAGGPERLVSGEVEGTRYVLDRDGREETATQAPEGAAVTGRRLRELAEIAARADFLFGGPQDVEWAVDAEDRLWVLQSRPVTTDVAGVPVGPVFGTGPVAETFPEPLSALEQDLWVEPLRRALREAFAVTGMVAEDTLDTSPIVVSVGGRVAVDLTLFGQADTPQAWYERLDPRPRLRRIAAGWRVGRLRSALPGLAEDLITRTDRELCAVPPLEELTDRQLVGLLKRVREALAAVHAHEVLVGLLVDPESPRLTGTSVALRVLDHARSDGVTDEEILARHPVVLALTAPSIGNPTPLPAPVESPPWQPGDDDDAALLREALRLRVRWLQELGARAAEELGHRLHSAGTLDDPVVVRHMHLDGVEMALRGRAVPWRRTAPEPSQPEEPLPARFRLTRRGAVVPVRSDDGGDGGTGAGGGQGRGPVSHDAADPPEGSVVVLRNLDPQLATVLPRVAGIVSETGNVLAHVAILAREAGVPTVVGLADATRRFGEGAVVEVNGTTGDVREVDNEQEHDA